MNMDIAPQSSMPETPLIPLPAQQKSKFKSKVFFRIGVSILSLAAVAIIVFLSNPANIFHAHKVEAATANYFSVVSVSPAVNSQDNDPMAPVVITFSQPVDPNTLHGYFTINPMVPGTFTQGSTTEQVVFTPKFTLGYGTSVNVTLNKGFRSKSGALFASDYTYNYYTAGDDDTVYFTIGDVVSYLDSALPNQDVDINLGVGSTVDPNWQLVVYKGTLPELLKSLTYSNTPYPGTAYVTQQYIDGPVDTSGFQEVASTTGLQDNSDYNFNQGPGLYYIEAVSQGQVVGYTWVNVTDQGLMARQDDQAVSIATQDEQTGDTDENVQASLYNLENTPTLIGSATVDGTSSIPVTYPESADLLVGQTSEGLILVPLNVPETQADQRVDSNLSERGTIYLYTDRPTYQTGDTVQFAGVARIDNDAQYTIPPVGGTVRVWIESSSGTSTLMDMQVPVNADGSFSGSFQVPSEAADGDSEILYAQLDSDPTKFYSLDSYTTFDVEDSPDPGLITITYNQSNYTQGQPITATITGTDNSGNPLAGQQVTYDEYTLDYDSSSAAPLTSDWGNQLGGDQMVTLDQNGKATVTLTPDVSNSSMAVTLDAYTTINGVQTYGAKTALMRQGNIMLSFGSGRTNYEDGDTTVTRVYARDLNGNPIPNLKVSYRLYDSDYDNDSQSYTENDLSSGNAVTDSNGLAVIQQPVTLASSTQAESPYVEVSAVDPAGNTVTASTEILVSPTGDDAASYYYYHVPELTNFDVATDKESYEVGDTATLTINSSFDQSVWVTLQRGRVYQSELMHLVQGDNELQIPITAELGPSFDIDFNYYRNGEFNSEGLTIPVDETANKLTVSVGTDKSSYNPGDTATLAVDVRTTSGTGVPAHVSVTILDNSIFNLRDVTSSGDIFWSYFMPRADTTTLSSSLLGIGTGDGCGGGSGDDYPYIPNRLGTTIYWNSDMSTDQNGLATLSVPIPDSATGDYRVIVRAWSGVDLFGQVQSNIIVQ